MRRFCAVLLAGCLACGGAAPPAAALEFSRLGKGPDVLVLFEGTIERGDNDRFGEFLASLAPDEKVVGIVLNSPGGSLNETEPLMFRVGRARWPALVPSGAVCASACTLLFAAAGRRLAGTAARIGVHNARLVGEAPYAGAAEAANAELVKLGVLLVIPAPIIDKMAATPASSIAWLTPADLRLWGVTVVDDAAAVASSRAPPPAGAAAVAARPSPGARATLPAGADATRVQARLAELGYYAAGVDGIWGPASQKALADFKAASGLAGDGEWNAATEAALFAAGAVRQPGRL